MHAFKINGIATHSAEVTYLNLTTYPSAAATAVPA